MKGWGSVPGVTHNGYCTVYWFVKLFFCSEIIDKNYDIVNLRISQPNCKPFGNNHFLFSWYPVRNEQPVDKIPNFLKLYNHFQEVSSTVYTWYTVWISGIFKKKKAFTYTLQYYGEKDGTIKVGTLCDN